MIFKASPHNVQTISEYWQQIVPKFSTKRRRNQARKRMSNPALAKQAHKPGYCYHRSRTAASNPTPPGRTIINRRSLPYPTSKQVNTGTDGQKSMA
jgi:hypothetical protein